MAYVHIGHDSRIGDSCILANAATLAGHVIVEDSRPWGPCARFTSTAPSAATPTWAAGTTITQDVLPFSLTSAKRETHAYGLNKVGLQRRGFTREQSRPCSTRTVAAGRQAEHLAGH